MENNVIIKNGSYLENVDVLEFFLKKFHIIPCGSYNSHDFDYDATSIGNAAKNGLIFIDTIANNMGLALGGIYKDTTWRGPFATCKNLYGLSDVDWSSTFNKTIERVAYSPLETLIGEQMLHYFSTYGLESLGCKAIPWVPVEDIFTNPLTRPNLEGFNIFKIVSDEEAIKMFFNYLYNVKALPANEKKAIKVIMANNIKQVNVDAIKSHEVKIIYYNISNTVPSDGEDWIRYVIYRVTGQTLLIKDKKTIETIRNCPDYEFNYKEAIRKTRICNLAKVFHRFKPIFLAMRSQTEARPLINRIRKLANIYHVPMKQDICQNLVNIYLSGDTEKVKKMISKCTGRELIKLHNFVSYQERREPVDVYTIRNGKVWCNSDKKANNISEKDLMALVTIIDKAIMKKYSQAFKGKNISFYMPSYIHYACPVSEKQFIDNIPYGTVVGLPKDGTATTGVTMAIHWENEDMDDDWYNRVDLDLHLNSEKRHYGWNGSYRSEDDSQVYYSGDMTSAPKPTGATEAFYLNPDKINAESFVLTVNAYHAPDGHPFQFFMSKQNFAKYLKGWNDTTIDSENGTKIVDITQAIFPPISLKFDCGSRGKTIGVFNKYCFYFYGGNTGESIVPSKYYPQYLQGLMGKLCATITLSELFMEGAIKNYSEISLNHLTEKEKSDIMSTMIDLTPGVVTAKTLMDIIDAPDNPVAMENLCRLAQTGTTVFNS